MIDDDPAACSALETSLRADGFATSTASDGETALAEARRACPDVVLTGFEPTLLRGTELCERLREIDRELPVIFMTSHSDLESVVATLRAGADDYVIKPLEYEAVRSRVERALARRAERRGLDDIHRALNERLLVASIREQVHAEDEATQCARLNMLLENLSEGVAVSDSSGRVTMLNAAARTILGIEESGLFAAEAAALGITGLDGRPLGSEEGPLSRAARGEQFVDYEVLVAKPTGERRRVVFTGTSAKDENGEVALAIVVFRDVTDIRRLEQQREEYLALISHDLRNPIASILMATASLKRSMAKSGLIRDVNLTEGVERNVARVASMLEELTEATSLELHGVELERVECDLRKLALGAVESIGSTDVRRITIEAAPGPPYWVLADAARLERVIANLLTNALKYSARVAPVVLRLSREEGAVELAVIDSGIGVAPEAIEMIFDRYYRATAGKTRTSGLGLGLYIARLIVEAHGGRIDVSSELGIGSTFTLRLPSATSGASPLPKDRSGSRRIRLMKEVVERVRAMLARSGRLRGQVPGRID